MTRNFLFAMICAVKLQGLPTDPAIIAGSVDVMPGSASSLHISASDRSLIEWNSFSINQGESVCFLQPSSQAVVLNRVTGGEASSILGALTANGKIYLINANGILVGPEGLIDTKGFLASTIDVSNDLYLAGGNLLFLGDSTAEIAQLGEIRTPGGETILIAAAIDQRGTISASEGLVSLASASRVLLTPENHPFVHILADFGENASIQQAGTIEALCVEIQAGSVNPYALGIRQDGRLDALSLSDEGGKIILRAEGVPLSIGKNASLNAPQGKIAIEAANSLMQNEGVFTALEGEISISATGENPFFQMGTIVSPLTKIQAPRLTQTGKILADSAKGDGGSILIHITDAYIETSGALLSANGSSKGGMISISAPQGSIFTSGKLRALGDTGGVIALEANRVTLAAALLDASGISGGGEIRIPSSSDIHINHAAILKADASLQGHGGKIIVLSENTTECFGSLFANGGSSFGDGGFIEVSGKGSLLCAGPMTAAASRGRAGTVLLDPMNITIDDTTGIYPEFQLIDPSSGSGTGFGNTVLPLSTGNIVVTHLLHSVGSTTNVGAVYLYNGLSGALISVITGSQTNDAVGSSGVVALTNGNYVVRSPSWNNGVITDAGAATWGDGSSGISGVVSAANSLVGATMNDNVSGSGITALTNGNYVVRSTNWDNPDFPLITNVGAATWGNGLGGTVGAVTSLNSLVGSAVSDNVSIGGVFALTNGNYVVSSQNWDNGALNFAGAATWGDGSVGVAGVITSSNSLVGSTGLDLVSSGGVVALTNGNYVVRSPSWDNGAVNSAGAATWGDGSVGVTGVITSSNSLVGTTTSDSVSNSGVTALTNGNYVVASQNWDNGVNNSAGAATWGDGSTGVVGVITSLNSLVGTVAVDRISSSGVTALTNGNYVVASPLWNNGVITDAGAATWGDGSTGTVGAVTTLNSLIGVNLSDQVAGNGITALTNGNYVVCSSLSDAMATNGGAATWGDGSTGTVGTVTAANSLVGTTIEDRISSGGVTALTNGNYVVLSINWDNPDFPLITNVGAATWGNGLGGTVGAVTSLNSLVGSSTTDIVSSGGVFALTNGNYVVSSSSWNNGALNSAGAATWGNGSSGTTGAVASSNSFVGTAASDSISNGSVTVLTSGNFVVRSASWDNGSLNSAGAATLGDGTDGSFLLNGAYGALNAQNSVVGTTASSALGAILEDTVNQTVVIPFSSEGASGGGKVHVAIQSPNQMTYQRGQAQTMTIPAVFITHVLDSGTDVTIQANNDILITSPLIVNNSGGSGGNLSISAGKSVTVNANITTDSGDLTITANDTLASGVVDTYRSSGDAVLLVGSGVAIDVGEGSASLSLLSGDGKTYSASGDLTIDTTASISASGSGGIFLFAKAHNIQLNSSSLLQTANGALSLIAGQSIIGSGAITLKTTGTGSLTLASDNLFPTSPGHGSGFLSLASATLSSGGPLRIYSVIATLNSLPSLINNTPIVSRLSQTPVYYPDSPLSGFPYALYYKILNPSSVASAIHYFSTTLSECAKTVQPNELGGYLWFGPWPPMYTPAPYLILLPSLVHVEEE